MKKGLFIVIEGIDGAGKGVQSKLLVKWLKETKGRSAFLTMEPTSGKIGRLLRDALKTESVSPESIALLFAADRMEHMKEINQKLTEGKVVVCDRYFYSSIAYQGAQGVELEWIKTINQFAIIPDVVIYLDIAPEKSLGRISSKESFRSLVKEKEFLEKKDFLEKVRKNYLDLSYDNLFVTVDAKHSIDEIQTSIRKTVGRLLPKNKDEKGMDLRSY